MILVLSFIILSILFVSAGIMTSYNPDINREEFKQIDKLSKKGVTTIYEHPPDILTPQEADQVLSAIEKQKQTKLL